MTDERDVRTRFESAERGARLSKEELRDREPELRVDLLNAQFDLREADFSVVLLIAGDDLAGCQDALDFLHEWMDARLIDTESFLERTPEERAFPAHWRYWSALPAHGRIGLFSGAWVFDALAERLLDGGDGDALDRATEHARAFEQALAADGTLLLKVWMHAPKKELKRRLKRVEKRRQWRVAERERGVVERYDELVEAATRYIARTDAPHAPWLVVESTDREHRDLTLAEAVRDALTGRLRQGAAPEPAVPPAAEVAREPVLPRVDLGARLERDEYKARLDAAQDRLAELSIAASEAELATVLVFEGWDAAGKGGAIRRLTRAMAARDYRVHSFAAPTEEERAHHYLWRFWRRLPRAGRIGFFDRSWYGRVLVERVEGFATEAQWRRGYDEIADFERHLVEHGVLVRKFWLHIDPDEQLRRFEARENTPYKKYKITAEDYRNRERWDDYARAVEDMVARTHTPDAPWLVVPANDKPYARVAVIEEVCGSLAAALEAR
ncbi:MAG: polyphosphate:AMP phosphotransferase [Planctomycetota bacterium]